MTWWEYILTVWGVVVFGALSLAQVLLMLDNRKKKKINDLWEDWYERS